MDSILEDLTESDGENLIQIARNGITGNKIGTKNFSGKLNNVSGAFVTINENSSLGLHRLS